MAAGIVMPFAGSSRVLLLCSKPDSPKPPNSSAQNRAEVAEPLLQYVSTVSQGFLPTKRILVSSIKSSSLLPSALQGQTIHAHVIKVGLGSDRFVGSSLVWFYSVSGFPAAARRVFDGVLEKDTALYTAMLVVYAKKGDIRSARSLFDGMPDRDVVSWNAMLSGYAQCGSPEDALELFREMQVCRVGPNDVSLVAVLSACSRLGCLALGEWVHVYIDRNPNIVRTATLNNSLVHMYAKCGRLDIAFRLFVDNELKNLESWNTMLTSFAVHGCGTAAISLFSQMVKNGVLPDRITFLGILMACSHAGLVEDAGMCFTCMRKVYAIEPTPEHYGCIVGVLARWGHLKEADMIIKAMPFEPDASIWGALLSGCCTHYDHNLGLEAAGKLIELEPWDESRYIALVNLCVRSGSNNMAMKVRKKMTDAGIKKTSSSSAIEIDGVVHVFIAGDVSHYRSIEIYSTIISIVNNIHSELDPLESNFYF